MPAKANTPVSGMEPPKTSVSLSCAWTVALLPIARANTKPKLVANQRIRRFILGNIGFLLQGGFYTALYIRQSVFKGPQMEESANTSPDFCQPMGLENQKAHD